LEKKKTPSVKFEKWKGLPRTRSPSKLWGEVGVVLRYHIQKRIWDKKEICGGGTLIIGGKKDNRNDLATVKPTQKKRPTGGKIPANGKTNPTRPHQRPCKEGKKKRNCQ